MDCLKTNTTYVKTNASYLALVKQMPAVLAALDIKIAAGKADADAATAKADALDAQILTQTAKLTQFQAEAAALSTKDKNTVIAKTGLTVKATYDLTIRSLTSAIRANTAASAAYRKTGKSVATMQAIRATTVSQLAQTKAGVAQTLSMRNMACGKGL